MNIYDAVYHVGFVTSAVSYTHLTDMGVNMAGNCIVDDEVCREASRNEIVRRYFKALCDQKTGKNVDGELFKLELLRCV